MRYGRLAAAFALLVLALTALAACGHTHSLTFHEEREAACTEDGNTAYWSCDCGKYFSDEAGSTEIAEGSWILPAVGHDFADGICQNCGALQTEEVKYELNAYGTGYTAVGVNDLRVTEVVIPSVYRGLPVTAIEMYAFYGCNSLTSVVIPDSVTAIGEEAFSSCSNLTDVTLPDSVTDIGRNAFEGTALFLDEANWEDGALYVGRHLIQARDTLSEPYEVKPGTLTIAKAAFASCKDLPAVTIPDSVTVIGERAFSGCGLTSVEIPDSVTVIGDEAFSGCGSLTSVVIGEGVTEIGDFAFYECQNLTSAAIGNSVTVIGKRAFSA